MSTTGAEIIHDDVAICWLRRDLRLKDNAALYFALKENRKVIPLFIFDTDILDDLDDKQDKRIDFIHQSLAHLKNELELLGSSLLVLHGKPADIFKRLTPKVVYANHDYEPYGIGRDRVVHQVLNDKGINFKTYKDQVIFEKGEVLKHDKKPYTVFTPYAKAWKANINTFYLKSYPSEKYHQRFLSCKSLPMPGLAEVGFHATYSNFPVRLVRIPIIEKYHKQRNYPGVQGTTRLSVHLRFGTISIRKLVQIALRKNEAWLNELVWREFYQMILWHFPHVVTRSFKAAYDNIPWRNDVNEFNAWCEGRTGYPIVDAGMRELNNTGFMHNRVRMITASFLTKHLLIDWRWGEAYFAKKLLDYDLPSNNGGWQWAAGSGCDAAPYFRVFNPERQADKFDPDGKYVHKWIPEYGGENYPEPIIDHKFAKERALAVYKAALS